MNDDMGFLVGGALMFMLLFFAVVLVVGIIFLLSLQRALDAVSPECRKIPSG